MEDKPCTPLVLDGAVRSIKCSTATAEEIRRYSINECPISHPSQLGNPFLGLPLESGRCESCGTAEIGNCEGHFGHIELPIPVYHPSHVSELRDILSLICLKCMRMKKAKVGAGKEKVSSMPCPYCRDLPPIFIKEARTTDGAIFLELTVSSRTRMRDGFWNFLDRFGFRYGGTFCRPLLAHEALNILKQIPEETKRKLVGKGYFPQSGFIMQHLPVPPNCLRVPEISDGKCIMSNDISKPLLKKVLNKIELIKRSRSGDPNFESHEIEANDLQSSISQYMNLRGAAKAPNDVKKRFVLSSDSTELSTKQWLEKIRTLFIRKGSGFSSRCVITGDPYIGVNVVGLPSEIAKRITFEERVTQHNISHLQKIVDNGLCITYKDGSATYAISLGSKGHTNLKIGQIINRQIIDGDIVFINRPPSTHKHSLQAFRVYIHDDHIVKINPLICFPLGADFDGDCIHIFYPQSLSAKAEVVELFSVEKQLLSSHSGTLNLQLVHDSLLGLKLLSNCSFLGKTVVQQLAMFVSPMLPPPAIIKAHKLGPCWTNFQILQSVLPSHLNSSTEHYCIYEGEIQKFDSSRDIVQALLTDIPTSIHGSKGPKEAINFFNCLQPLLMEMLFMEGFSISLKDFDVPKAVIEEIHGSIQQITCILEQLRSEYNELVELQVENHIKSLKAPIVDFVVKFSALGNLIDPKSESAIVKVAEQLGFLGLQLFERGKYYSRALVENCFRNFVNKHSYGGRSHPSEAYGLVKSSFFHGLAPYEELVHAISSREVMVRSSRGLTEPGTLFKNLMAILRDVVICYDASVRNVVTGSIVQFDYFDNGLDSLSTPAGEPVGVLAATAISNHAYKAVLDSSQNNNSSWELMKEILLCKISFQNDISDRRVTLYLNDCYCPRNFCKENAAYTVLNCLKKVSLRDCACDFSIKYKKQIDLPNSSMTTSGLVGHIHLDKMQLKLLDQTTDNILRKCQDVISSYGKKKGQLSHFLKRVVLSSCESCSTKQPSEGDPCHSPCLQFSYSEASAAQHGESLQRAIHVMANVICPILLDTIVKGNPRIFEAKIVWIGPEATSWVRNSQKTPKGELGLEIVVEKDSVRENGDAWRIAMDACLPVIHLIDTSRSVPYGIQQIQDLLGISCAFDQSVQRLSRSIRMVAKGVMKEHLLLVASSMTCSGNLIGFNTSGYKALFRSFKVQVPFTAATLFTPMKCFENAAEKCHTDSLASVVSSCSWGKKVAIGTGAPFQILWDKKQLATSKDTSKGVYDFLELLRPTTSGEAIGPCLADVDDLAEDVDFDEVCLSPEPDRNMTFEDSDEAEYNREVGKSSWDMPSGSGAKSDNWQVWESREPTDTANGKLEETNTNGWSSWDSSQAKPKATVPANKVNETSGPWETEDAHNDSHPSDEPDAWAKGKLDGNTNGWGSESQDVKLSGQDIWSENVTKNKLDQEEKPSLWKKKRSWSSEGKSSEHASFSSPGAWGSESSKEPPDQSGIPSQDGWGCAKHLNTNTWDSGAANPTQNSSGWGSSVGLDTQTQNSSGWGSSVGLDTRTQNSSGWGFASRKNTSSGRKQQGAQQGAKRWNSNKNTFSASNRRIESLTTEEESILAEVEPIMQRIKKIMRDASDGDRISEDDQKFILEGVFEHHPQKQSKVTDQVDYIVVDKHTSFSESRCFYVVSSDGTRNDFSYIKCMSNFVKKTYPEHGESFGKKYFRTRRPASQTDDNNI
ncbi:DNA-directed RNA polymerase V subunit 1 isoform X1 [Canna indica]|uniref:DNA-directed RNA polymerase n=1 Tax=Canna indica TaxID=4628 RepID=A0AAQ3KHL4_9LILI|nr:DNA-directed RNA polymerase V subunit 1 isoform X1 [Canna indica]